PLIVHQPTLKHYVDLLEQTNFLTWTYNTMLVAVVTTVVSLVLGVMIAYPLARMNFPGAAVVAIGVAATYLVPQPLLFIPMADIINRLDLGNTLSAVMLTYPTLLIPFCAWLLMGYFKSVPRELEEAARIDGASRFQAMLRIVLPLCTPGLLSAGIFAFTLAQNEFLYALIFLTKSDVRTVPVGAITELIRGDVFYWGQLMAAALLRARPRLRPAGRAQSRRGVHRRGDRRGRARRRDPAALGGARRRPHDARAGGARPPQPPITGSVGHGRAAGDLRPRRARREHPARGAPPGRAPAHARPRAEPRARMTPGSGARA